MISHSVESRHTLSVNQSFFNVSISSFITSSIQQSFTCKGDSGQAHTHRTSWSVFPVSDGLNSVSGVDMATYSSNMGHLPSAVYEARRISPPLVQSGVEDEADFDETELVAVRCQKE